MAGQKSCNDLSETARKKVSAYFQERGLLYDVEEELEKSYANYRDRNPNKPVPSVGQDITAQASSDRVIYFLTAVDTPIHGDGTATMEQLRLSDAFDQETGERIDMPTEAEARQRIAEKFEADMEERGCDVVVHEVSLEYVLTSQGGTLVPAWRVIMEEVDGIKDEETGEAVSIWDCYFFNALTGEEYEGP